MDPNKLVDLISSGTFQDPQEMGSNKPSSKLKFLRGQRLSLDSRIDIEQIRALGGGPKSDQGERYKDRYQRHSFDLGFFKTWRRGSLLSAKRFGLRSRKKLVRQCESFEEAIPEEDMVVDRCNSRDNIQLHRHSLDLFDLPSAIKQLRKSFKAIR